MKKNKLIALLSTFGVSEMKQFVDFVSSPIFNKNEVLVTFIKHLEKLFPHFEEEALTKEKLSQILFPGLNGASKKLYHYFNYLLKLAEQFIALNQILKDQKQMQLALAKELVERNLEKHFENYFEKIQVKTKSSTFQSTQSFHHQYSLSELASDYATVKKGKKLDPYFQKASNYLDDYYFLTKLKYICEMLNRQKIFSADYQFAFEQEVIKHLKKRKHIPSLIEAYLNIYFCLTQPPIEPHFNQLLYLIRVHGKDFELEELRQVYLHAINLSVRHIRKGQNEYIPITLDLYTEGIDRKALFEKEYLTHWTYTNVVKLALMLERFEWIEGFINQYSTYLNPQIREDTLHYNLAELYYRKKEFDQVFEHLHQLQFSDIRYHLGSRVIMIKTYYEYDDIEPLLSSLASFSVFLRRHKNISQDLKKTHLNFCSLLHKILRNNPRHREKVKEQIQTLQPLTERTWLLKIWKDQNKRF